MSAERTKIIACSLVIEEIVPYLPSGMDCQTLDSELHVNTDVLRRSLQEAIDASTSSAEIILLGYGLCSQAVVGLQANGCTLVIPKVDDCIALFLGSEEAYKAQFKVAPGTYYLTKSWIESGRSIFDEYNILVDRYGESRALSLMRNFLKHYTRLALINTGRHELEFCRDYCLRTADRFGLRYEEIPGSSSLFERIVQGPHDNDFVIVQPNEIVTFRDFK
ncbi:MAG: DUF1638 domain-containing protein [Anaerolineales bacterium]|nr:MAG: DUF1638 domain-containing protein [Anaerolineales bacterium]